MYSRKVRRHMVQVPSAEGYGAVSRQRHRRCTVRYAALAQSQLEWYSHHQSTSKSSISTNLKKARISLVYRLLPKCVEVAKSAGGRFLFYFVLYNLRTS